MFVSGPTGTSVISPGRLITWSTMNCAAVVPIAERFDGGRSTLP